MKNIFKVLLCVSIINIFGINGVKADVGDHVYLNRYDIDNVWAYHYRNGEMWSYGQLPFRYANDKLVYCIQPDVRISTHDYIIYDFNRSGYGEDAKQKMELIAYYGYKYDNHDDLKYYIATQDLIWRLSPDEDIRWTTGGEYGEEIDISKEKEEILNLISKHNVLPEFNDSINEVYVNEKIELIDNNNVLSNYDIEYSDDLEVIKEDNKLIITPKKEGEYTINFIHKKNYDSGTFLYDNFNTLTQSVAIFGAPTLIDGSMKIKAKSKCEITVFTISGDIKLDSDFEVYDLEGNLVYKGRTINGEAKFELEYGNYKIKELSVPDGYKLSDKEISLEVNDISCASKVTFDNEKIVMPVTSKEYNLGYLLVLFLDVLGYVFIKKNS